MEVLEERDNALIIQDDNKEIILLEKTPYNLLKYKFYRGKKIRYIANDQETISLQETDVDGVFECTLAGSMVTIKDSKVEVARAIFDAQVTKNLDPLHSLWKLKYLESFLAIRIVFGNSSPVDLTREGELIIPKSVSLNILEWMEYRDGGRLAKLELSREKNSTADRVFTHETQINGRPRVIVNDRAIVLLGRDETDQLWMHVVPPEYKSRSITSCELWLCGGYDEKDVLMDT